MRLIRAARFPETVDERSFEGQRVAVAARWGDPLFSANALQPRENYLVLIDRYREQLLAQFARD